jgi:hypothetical protein
MDAKVDWLCEVEATAVKEDGTCVDLRNPEFSHLATQGRARLPTFPSPCQPAGSKPAEVPAIETDRDAGY